MVVAESRWRLARWEKQKMMREDCPLVRDFSEVGDRKKKLAMAGRRKVGRKTKIERKKTKYQGKD